MGNFEENILEKDLEFYFSGLTKRRAIADKDEMKFYFPARASLKKTGTSIGDRTTYAGVIHIYDAQITKKPADLFIKVHAKSCSDGQKTILLFEISGNPKGHAVWEKLDKINADFNCSLK